MSDLVKRFTQFLVKARSKTDDTMLSVEVFSERYAKKLGKEFNVNNSTVSRYERGSMPSPPKLLTLARAYGIPVGKFFEALGGSELEVYGRKLDPVLNSFQENPGDLEAHQKLQKVLRGVDAETVVEMIDFLLSKHRARKPARSNSKPRKQFGPG